MFKRDVEEDSSLLGCYVMLTGKHLPNFRRIVVYHHEGRAVQKFQCFTLKVTACALSKRRRDIPEGVNLSSPWLVLSKIFNLGTKLLLHPCKTYVINKYLTKLRPELVFLPQNSIEKGELSYRFSDTHSGNPK